MQRTLVIYLYKITKFHHQNELNGNGQFEHLYPICYTKKKKECSFHIINIKIMNSSIKYILLV